MFYDIDDRQFPKVMVRFAGTPATDDEFLTLLRDLGHLYERRTAFTIAFDTRKLGKMPFRYVKLLAAWIKANRENAEQFMPKSAVVITSAVVRAFLNAVLLVAKPSSDLKVCKSVRLAVQHLGWVVPARSG